MNRTPAKHEIAIHLRVLQTINCHGYENPIPSDMIEQQYQISDRKVRDIVLTLRREGEPIAHIGGKKDGYFRASTWGELEPSYLDLKSRAMSELETCKLMAAQFNIEGTLFQ